MITEQSEDGTRSRGFPISVQPRTVLSEQRFEDQGRKNTPTKGNQNQNLCRSRTAKIEMEPKKSLKRS
jgi:hypothetical protein